MNWYDHLELVLKFMLISGLIVVDVVMFVFLVDNLTKESDITPAVSAIVGTLVGAITTLISIGGKDFFNAAGKNGSK